MSPGKSLTTHKDALSVVSLSFERGVIKSGTSGRLSYVPDRFVKSTFVAKSTSPSVTPDIFHEIVPRLFSLILINLNSTLLSILFT